MTKLTTQVCAIAVIFGLIPIISGIYILDVASLLAAGGSDDNYRERQKVAISVGHNINYINSRSSKDTLVGFHCATDEMTFGGRDYINFGPIYTTPSLGTPAKAQDSPINRELASLAPKSMLYLNPGEVQEWDLDVVRQATTHNSSDDDWMSAPWSFDLSTVAKRDLFADERAFLNGLV
jgi:hypothetical protein